MSRLLVFLMAASALLFACQPPVRLIPSRVSTGLDSVEYTGVLAYGRRFEAEEARFLAKVKVGDLGVSLDCTYPDVLNYARDKARGIGGNLIIITEHEQYQEKSRCHRIKGEIYTIASLEGLEEQILWHPKRPLLAGDLTGEPGALPAPLPPIACAFRCRIAGDYYKEAILRTETTFETDSTWLIPNNTKLALRRAQLHFDIAELHARRLKAALVALGPDLPAITGQYRSMASRQLRDMYQQRAALDAELASGDKDAVLARWENLVRGELSTLEQYFGDVHVDLRKKGRRS